MNATRQCAFLLVSALILSGCASIPRWSSNPFSADDSVDISDPQFANTKSARIEQIRAVGRKAKLQNLEQQEQSTADLVTRIQDETDAAIRIELATALGEFKVPAAIGGLRTALSDSRPNVRMAACNALANAGSAEALSLLGAVVGSDPNLDVRVAATRAIGDFQGPLAIKALLPAISDADPALQYAAVRSMKKLHTEDLGNNVAEWQNLARSMSVEGLRVATESAVRK